MTDEIAELILKELRLIQASTERMQFDIHDLKVRMSIVERTAGQIAIALGALNNRMDRFDERLGRIERRLDRVEVTA